jgi:hypothetical protein
MKLRSLQRSATLEFYAPDYGSTLALPFFDVGVKLMLNSSLIL